MRPQARRGNLLIEEFGDELVVYDLERHRAHRLSRPTALIWRHSDGKRSVAELARIVETELNVPADEEVVWLVLSELEQAHLLQELLLRPAEIAGISRREAIALGLAGAATLLLEGCGVDSITAPTPVPGPAIGERLAVQPNPRCNCLVAGQGPPHPTAGCTPPETTTTTSDPGTCVGPGCAAPGAPCRVTAHWECKAANVWAGPTNRTHDCALLPPPPPPPSGPPPSPPPSPPPPPPACIGTFPNLQGENGQGATEALAKQDLIANATKDCRKVCNKQTKTCIHPDDCVPDGLVFQEATPACVENPGAPGKKRWQCVQTLVACKCKCGFG